MNISIYSKKLLTRCFRTAQHRNHARKTRPDAGINQHTSRCFAQAPKLKKTRTTKSPPPDRDEEQEKLRTAIEERHKMLESCGFSQKWQSDNDKWLKQVDKEISAYQVYAHKMGRYLAPLRVSEHTHEHYKLYFGCNKELLPGGVAGDIIEDWKNTFTHAMMIRKEMLEIVEFLKDLNLRDDRVEQSGTVGSDVGTVHALHGSDKCGKSCLLNYIGFYARENDWLTIWIPHPEKLHHDPHEIHIAVDRPKVYYQNHVALQFFQQLQESSSHLLSELPLKRQYVEPTEESQPSPGLTTKMLSGNIDETQKGAKKDSTNSGRELTAEEYEALMDAAREGRIAEKQQDETAFDWEADASWKLPFSSDGVTGFLSNSESSLLDLVKYGANPDNPNPASLMYDFIEEVKLVDSVPVIILMDNVNLCDKKSGYPTSDGDFLPARQLSMVDGWCQFETPGLLKNGVAFYATTSMHRKYDTILQSASKIHQLPLKYTFDEYETALKHLESCGAFKKKNDFNLQKVESLSGRVPGDVTKIASQY